MAIVLVTGSAGLIGSESVRFFCDKGYTVVGIDNNMRQVFFGEDASRSGIEPNYRKITGIIHSPCCGYSGS